MNLGSDAPIKALGRELIVGRLKYSILSQFFAWLRVTLGDPFQGLDGIVDKAPPDVAKRLVDKAEAERDALRSMDITSDEVMGLLKKPMIIAQLFFLMLKSKQPEITEDDAFDVVRSVPPEELNKAIQTAMGESAPNAAAPA